MGKMAAFTSVSAACLRTSDSDRLLGGEKITDNPWTSCGSIVSTIAYNFLHYTTIALPKRWEGGFADAGRGLVVNCQVETVCGRREAAGRPYGNAGGGPAPAAADRGPLRGSGQGRRCPEVAQTMRRLPWQLRGDVGEGRTQREPRRASPYGVVGEGGNNRACTVESVGETL